MFDYDELSSHDAGSPDVAATSSHEPRTGRIAPVKTPVTIGAATAPAHSLTTDMTDDMTTDNVTAYRGGGWVGDAFADLDPDPDHLPEPPPGLPDLEELLASVCAADAPAMVVDLSEGELSGWLALELDHGTADHARLSDRGLIDGIVAFEKLSSWAVARQAQLLGEFNRRRPGDSNEAAMCDRPSIASRWAPDEVGLALTLTRGAAIVRLDHAARLTAELAPTLELLERGELDVPKARAICFATTLLPPDTAAAVQDRVLPKAPTQTVQQLRAALARAIIATDPATAAERHRRARDERRVRIADEGDGMASFWALLTAPDAVAAYESLTRLARSLGKDDPRGMDARRADLLADLLTGRLEFRDDEPDPAATTPADADADDSDTDSEATDPEATEPEATEPEATEPEATEPEATEPEATEPGSADAGVAAGGVTGGVGTHRERDCERDRERDCQPVDQAPEDCSGESTGSRREDPDPGSAGEGPPHTEQQPGTSRPERCTWRPLVRRPAPGAKPLVHVIIPYSTLIGADDQPCELSGYGPIPADLAREIAADGVWKRLLTDPASGTVLDHSRKTYRPPKALADFVRARDGVCRSPICSRRAINCELDHIVAWSKGGTTSEQNLMDGCIHHHHLKHQPGWTVRMLSDGIIEWTTPTGHRYRSNPYDYRPSSDPDPALFRRASARHDPHTDPASGRDLEADNRKADNRNTDDRNSGAGRAEPATTPNNPTADDRVHPDRQANRTRPPSSKSRSEPPRFRFGFGPPARPDQNQPPSTDQTPF